MSERHDRSLFEWGIIKTLDLGELVFFFSDSSTKNGYVWRVVLMYSLVRGNWVQRREAELQFELWKLLCLLASIFEDDWSKMFQALYGIMGWLYVYLVVDSGAHILGRCLWVWYRQKWILYIYICFCKIGHFNKLLEFFIVRKSSLKMKSDEVFSSDWNLSMVSSQHEKYNYKVY